ncbi:MAG: asparagine synthase (glutamine-hydrolyzing) [Chloroflexi bacterium]|nr:asparagine synthase (glutamine-hydrolyzing) [Chloroflexota bacterium]
MCGICGVVSRFGNQPVSENLLRHMNDTMQHRGPDDAGHYLDEQAGLAMRRLSIIDLSSGHQPIPNEDKTIWIVFNGEIYNYLEIRHGLEEKGHQFVTNSDTEAIVHAYEEYGDECVQHLNGMFGFAIWDTRRRRLLLARDRVGIKPMYYHLSPTHFIFGSELKAVIANPGTPREIDFVAMDQFLTLEYIPSPRTIFKNIHKLPPGHRLILEDDTARVEQYWNVEAQELPKGDEACIEALTELIRDAVKIRLMSDVPLGAFLSGGIDSSTIVSFMSELSNTPVNTFSIGFGDPTYNELPYARMVAEAYGTKHHEEFLEADINDLAMRLVSQFDEPFGDFSIFPTFLVSEVARRQVTVSLSGDGGDEIFGGYDTYVAQGMDAKYYGRLPRWLRQKAIPRMLDIVPPQPAKKGLINKAKRFVEGGALPSAWGHTRWMMFMHDQDKSQLYSPDVRQAINGDTPGGLMARYFGEAPQSNSLAQQQYVDVKTYMVDNILVKVDRMSMAASLEARVPLLDHRIVEFGLNLPAHLKMNGDETKVIIRRIMADRLPKAVLNKPKEGFSIPLKHWLRNDLRPLMQDLLSPEVVRRRGYFSPETVTRWVMEHHAKQANHSHRLWALMVFELWHRQVLDAHIVKSEFEMMK